MIRINLLPVKALQAEVTRRREIVIGAAVLSTALIVLVGLHLIQAYHLSGLESELTGLRSELQALNAKIKQVGDLQNKIKDLRGKNKIIEDLNKKKVGPVLVMENLAKATPTSVWLTELKETGGSVLISGLAVDNQAVADLISGLETSKHFKSVELIETTQGVGPTAGLKRFAVKAGVLYQAAEPDAPATKAKTNPVAKKEENKG